MLRIRGTAHHLLAPLVGTVTYDPTAASAQRILVIPAAQLEGSVPQGFAAVVTDAVLEMSSDGGPWVTNVLALEQLADGDVLSIDPNGLINRQYRADSYQNFLLATERCNSNCLMCSQPPKDRDDVPYLMELYRQVIPLIPVSCPELGITGGEPTLLGDAFFELLQLCKTHLPTTELHCLTNGRTFAWRSFAERLGQLELPQLMLGIPLYADHYSLHDYIVQAPGAFNQTVQGLHNLALFNQRIEIRIVLHQLSIPRLVKLVKFIYRNFPFVEHVVLMGLENTGYTPHNINKLWIDPADYIPHLTEAVEFLAMNRMNVSIYNHQLCLLPETLWSFARRSISDWKNVYLPTCEQCSVKDMCGGFFASCTTLHSQHIRPIMAEEPIYETNG
ncbi:His-Xaa-Ser system radical SAM maturase HxsC [Hymenobacter monticola]|uniref:His-Xaa-Ser system radical SAM maturase HxsC n=1 Tax=Hymenobacter monticola TaxID=1705399 RepID=A0ABY4B2D4_9BACT|nr:His-Xaa-Ser system radical SAM maturase HxsC [Hymenobacter monticola]UOE33289.1 His-Xaa-Ser system radical SAM maturase HxsC [Hymenobacter monticola]